MRRYAFLALIPLLAVAGCQGANQTKKDEDALQGTWIVVSMERDGEKNDMSDEKDEKKQMLVTIKGNEATMKLGDLGDGDTNKIKLDATQKPKHIDMTRTKKKDGKDTDVTTKCIYELEGDTLKICGPAKDDGDRPKELTAGKDSGRMMMTLKKKK